MVVLGVQRPISLQKNRLTLIVVSLLKSLVSILWLGCVYVFIKPAYQCISQKPFCPQRFGPQVEPPAAPYILPLDVVHVTCHLLLFTLYPYDLCVYSGKNLLETRSLNNADHLSIIITILIITTIQRDHTDTVIPQRRFDANPCSFCFIKTSLATADAKAARCCDDLSEGKVGQS